MCYVDIISILLKMDFELIVQCEHNAVLPPTSINHSLDQCINSKSLNE